MRSLPWNAQFYIVLLTALMASAVFFSVSAIQLDWVVWLTILGGGALIALLDTFGIRQFGVQAEISVSNAVKFALLLLAPPPIVIMAIFLGTLGSELFVKRVWFKKLFNTAEMALTWAVTGLVYALLNDPTHDYFGSVGNVSAVIVSGVTSFAVNIALVCLVISLAAGLPFFYVLKPSLTT